MLGKPTTIRLPGPLQQWLNDYAKANDRSFNYVLVALLEDAHERLKPRSKGLRRASQKSDPQPQQAG